MSKWKLGEKEVYDYYSTTKNSYCYRFSDTHDINAQLKRFGEKMVYTSAKPSDFLVIYWGRTIFLEVKTTERIRGVTNSLFSEQEGARDRILRCGGEYWYHIYSIANKQWYMVPGWVIAKNPNSKWEDLKYYKVDYLKELKE